MSGKTFCDKYTLPLVSGGGAFSFGSRVNGLSSTTHALYLDSSADYEEIELIPR